MDDARMELRPMGPGEREVLLDCMSRTLETMFYTFIDGDLTVALDEAGPALHDPAIVQFRGARNGALALALDEEAGSALAASFLGLDPDELTPADVQQVSNEMANILCGSFLSQLEPNGHFDLDAPVQGTTLELARLASHRDLQIPEGRLSVWWGFEVPAAIPA